MVKKLPPRKLSVVVPSTSRDTKERNLNVWAPLSQIRVQEQSEVASEIPGSLHFSQALHELHGDEPPQPTQLAKHDIDDVSLPIKIADEAGVTVNQYCDHGFERRWAYRNVLGIGFSFFFAYTAYFGLQNLQSSINAEGGLGVASLAVVYVLFAGFGFLSPSVLKILGTKYSLLAGVSSFLFYVVANVHPSWYTLIPAAVVSGMGSALIWAGASSHLLEVALIVAPKLKVESENLISIFTGMSFLFLSIAQIPGNLASSLILYPYGGLDDYWNSSGVDSCQYSSGHKFDIVYLYILCAVYALSVFLAILSSATVVSNLGTKEKFFSSTHKFKTFFKEPLTDLLKILVDYKMLLIAPSSVFNGLEVSFAAGAFTAIVASCFGTFQVGFTIISFGVTSALMSVVYGRAVKYVPMLTIFFFGGVINVALLIFLLLWTPTPSYPAIFSFAVLWGAADGVWNTMTTSLTGILFPKRAQCAYSAQRIWLAVGFTLGFILMEVLDLRNHVWFMLVAVVLVLCCSLIIEFVMHHKIDIYSNRVSAEYNTSTDSAPATVV